MKDVTVGDQNSETYEDERVKYGYKLSKLPELPDGLEWVVHADSDRFTVSLSHARPKVTNLDVDAPTEGKVNGYVMSHTHKHPAVIQRAEWEYEVCNAAQHLWTHYTEGN